MHLIKKYLYINNMFLSLQNPDRHNLSYFRYPMKIHMKTYSFIIL